MSLIGEISKQRKSSISFETAEIAGKMAHVNDEIARIRSAREGVMRGSMVDC